MAGTEIFIYYRIHPDDEASVRRHIDNFQQVLRQDFPGLQARLMRRREESAAQLTMMETYAFSPAAGAAPAASASADLLQAVALGATVIDPYLQSSRHVEVFEPCA